MEGAHPPPGDNGAATVALSPYGGCTSIYWMKNETPIQLDFLVAHYFNRGDFTVLLGESKTNSALLIEWS